MTVLKDGQVLTRTRLESAITEIATAIFQDAAPPAPVTEGVAPRTCLLTQQPAGRYGWWTEDYTESSDNVTLHDTRTLAAPAAWFRLGFMFDRPSGSSCTVAGALIAQSANESLVTDPVDTQDDPVDWETVTFNNDGEAVDLVSQLAARLAATPSPVTSLALRNPPANAAAWGGAGADYRKENYADWSDWINAPPFLRNDSGTLPLVMLRVKYSGDVSFAKALGASYDSLFGKFIKSYLNAGDCVTTPGDFASTTRSLYAANVVLQYLSAVPGIQVTSEGDSNEAPFDNHVARACAQLTSASLPIEFCSFAKGGNSVVQFTGALLLPLPAIRPSIAFIKAYSPADVSEAAIEAGWASSLALADAVKATGGIPVFMTGDPSPTIITTAELEERRLRINARVRALSATGAQILDIDSVMSNNATPIAGFLPGFSDDGLHRTSAAQAYIAENLTIPLLRTLIGV